MAADLAGFGHSSHQGPRRRRSLQPEWQPDLSPDAQPRPADLDQIRHTGQPEQVVDVTDHVVDVVLAVVDALIDVEHPTIGKARGSPGLLTQILEAAADLLAARFACGAAAIVEPRQPRQRPGRVHECQSYPEGADTAGLATGNDPADSLGAAPLAVTVEGPLLLTRAAQLEPSVSQALDDLGAGEVIIVGGPVAASDAVANALERLQQ